MPDETQTEIVEKETTVEVTEGEKTPQTAELQAELEKTRKALKDANREAAERRKKLEALELAESERKKAELSEVERSKQELQEWQKKAADAEAAKADAETKAREALMSTAVMIEATRQNFHNPDDAWRYVDREKLTENEDGTFGGVEKAVEAVLKARPYLGKGTKPGAPGTPPRKPERGGQNQNGQQTPVTPQRLSKF